MERNLTCSYSSGVSGAALALFGEAVKAGLAKWFRLLRPDRVGRCPRCGRENLVRALSSGEMLWFTLLILVFSLAFTATLLLSVATVLMLLALVIGGMDAGVTIGVAVALAVSKDDDHLGPPLGAGEIGMAVPDLVVPNKEFTVTLSDVDDPKDATCVVHDAATGRRVAMTRPTRKDGTIAASLRVPAPGMYRVSVHSSGGSPVSQPVLATDRRQRLGGVLNEYHHAA